MSAKNKSTRLKRIVERGLFAPELPPCFVSNDLARHRRSILQHIDQLPQNKNGRPDYYRFISEPAWFYFPRFGKEDRRHGTPNPIAHLLVSRVIANNYIDLRRKARASKLSLSPPVFDWSGPRALMRPSVDLRDDFRINLSSRREEYVVADFRAFFHSIYTHAIPWAIHGKQTAKADRKPTLYGNELDLLCRNAQDGQTVGLPVGPDTSRLIAEVVASAVDAHLQEHIKVGKRDSSRYIDDYTLSSANGASGEELLAALRKSAAFFELELNNEKSAIFLTSHRQNTGWQQAVRLHLPSSPFGPAEPSDVKHFFYQLGRVCTDNPDVNVEKFGLQHARSFLVNASDWNMTLLSLINAYRRNPSLISLLAEICILRCAAKKNFSKDIITEFIESRIAPLARANRTGEIIWLLFLAARLGLTLSSRRLETLFAVENAFIALLLVNLSSRGNINGDVDRSLWNRSLTSDGLRSPMWLYAYEAVTREFIPEKNDSFIINDPYFKILRKKRVQFLDTAQGYTSINATLQRLRTDNTRAERVREAIQDADFENLDDFDDGNDGILPNDSNDIY